MFYCIVLIFGDGIGVFVIDVVMVVVVKVVFGLLEIVSFLWFCQIYLEIGCMMFEDGIEILCGFDVIFLGVVGWFVKVFDSVFLYGLLLLICKVFV